MDRWLAEGLIDPGLRQRLESATFSASGFAHLQAILMLCAVILAGVGVVAFVAANWAGMAPFSRMAVLLAANAAAVAAAFVAYARHRANPEQGSWLIAEGASTLSLVASAASVALMAQTFHLPADMRSYAVTVAVLGAVTAFVTRSGGCAMITAVALLVAGSPVADFLGRSSGLEKGLSLWLEALTFVLLLGCASGWIAARTSTFLLILVSLAAQMGAYDREDFIRHEVGLTLAAAAIGASYGLALAMPERPGQPARDRLEMLARAAAGLALIAIAILAVDTLRDSPKAIRWEPGLPTFEGAVRLALAFAAPFVLVLVPRRLARAVPVGHLVVLAACAVPLALIWTTGLAQTLKGGALGPSWTVWVGLVPLLALAVAGHLDERRALFGWSMTSVAVLTVVMLSTSKDLMTFSVHLLVSAGLAFAAFAACRWADRRLSWRLA
jgi:hypothetical protein